MEIVDLSHTLRSDMSIYPGDPVYSCCPALTLANDGCNVQALSLGSHSGTHIDAPYHFFESGQRVDEIPLSRFIRPAIVIDLTAKTSRERITWEDLSPYEHRMHQAAKQEAILLLRTDWSRHWGTNSYFSHPFLDKHAAQGIIDTGIRFIGIDTLSPDETHVQTHDPNTSTPAPTGPANTTTLTDTTASDFAVHNVILGSGGLIAENLTNLSAIQSGNWLVSLVPLKLAGCDGSPVRAYAYKCPLSSSP